MILIMEYVNLVITLFTLGLCVEPPTKTQLENSNLHQPRVICYVLLVGATAVAMSWQLNGNWMKCHGIIK